MADEVGVEPEEMMTNAALGPSLQSLFDAWLKTSATSTVRVIIATRWVRT